MSAMQRLMDIAAICGPETPCAMALLGVWDGGAGVPSEGEPAVVDTRAADVVSGKPKLTSPASNSADMDMQKWDRQHLPASTGEDNAANPTEAGVHLR